MYVKRRWNCCCIFGTLKTAYFRAQARPASYPVNARGAPTGAPLAFGFAAGLLLAADKLRIGFHATLRQVHTFVLVFLGYPDTHHRFDDAPDNQAHYEPQTKMVRAPISWPLKLASPLVTGTSSRPSRPQTPWAEMAPTGSSMRSLSRVTMLSTTRMPPRAPQIVAVSALGVDGSAVITTRPAIAPLSSMVRSALPNIRRAVIRAAIAPPAAAALVFRNTMATELALATSPSFSTEPPLKPNQPIHRMKVPRAASGMLAPGKARISPLGPYLPLRGPSSSTPARAAAAPAMCTMPEPAKSLKPRSPRLYRPNTSLPPQVQEPSSG